MNNKILNCNIQINYKLQQTSKWGLKVENSEKNK